MRVINVNAIDVLESEDNYWSVPKNNADDTVDSIRRAPAAFSFLSLQFRLCSNGVVRLLVLLRVALLVRTYVLTYVQPSA